MVYGENITLPGEFFAANIQHMLPGTFINDLQNVMKLMKLKETQRKSHPKIFVHKDLESTFHVFLRIDGVRKPREPPYEGPYFVINRTPKYFTLRIKNKEVNVTIDRLKAAYPLPQENPEKEQLTTPTCVKIMPSLHPASSDCLILPTQMLG
ncbi:uncharacterized protein LOC129968323 [Argiope bruennichi]|uniref:uncharacterized protein LOC129968323 n=1 Tax=Argiope bruennichi TaxID=94029 RepID=UPI0024949C09|nr:uncharacterized protein LOC129968323 [Argiope bruennichi]